MTGPGNDSTNRGRQPQVGDTITVRFVPETKIPDHGCYVEANLRQITGKISAIDGQVIKFGPKMVNLSSAKVKSVELVSRKRLLAV